jgi:hypothetical protein
LNLSVLAVALPALVVGGDGLVVVVGLVVDVALFAAVDGSDPVAQHLHVVF